MNKPLNNYKEVQIQIKRCRDTFESLLSEKLNLIRASAPLIVSESSGLNDQLTGVQQSISFYVDDLSENVEIVQSLAKWKRVALKKYNIPIYEGIYTNMNAIRKDEILDNTHSIYVDQWDWEARINKKDRNLDMLKKYVDAIYECIFLTKEKLCSLYPTLTNNLPKEVKYFSSQELEDKFPNEKPEQREYIASKEYGAIFIIGIGAKLKSGKVHDSRSPDYDDWKLNGDLILWNQSI
ncbi:MAG: aspartate--ammonia ligase, partial [Mycoplasma sp.]